MSDEFRIDKTKNILQFCLLMATLAVFVGGVVYGSFYTVPNKVKEWFEIQEIEKWDSETEKLK